MGCEYHSATGHFPEDCGVCQLQRAEAAESGLLVLTQALTAAKLVASEYRSERDAAREALRELLEIYQEGVGFSHTALTQVTREKVRRALEGA